MYICLGFKDLLSNLSVIWRWRVCKNIVSSCIQSAKAPLETQVSGRRHQIWHSIQPYYTDSGLLCFLPWYNVPVLRAKRGIRKNHSSAFGMTNLSRTKFTQVRTRIVKPEKHWRWVNKTIQIKERGRRWCVYGGNSLQHKTILFEGKSSLWCFHSSCCLRSTSFCDTKHEIICKQQGTSKDLFKCAIWVWYITFLYTLRLVNERNLFKIK